MSLTETSTTSFKVNLQNVERFRQYCSYFDIPCMEILYGRAKEWSYEIVESVIIGFV